MLINPSSINICLALTALAAIISEVILPALWCPVSNVSALICRPSIEPSTINSALFLWYYYFNSSKIGVPYLSIVKSSILYFFLSFVYFKRYGNIPPLYMWHCLLQLQITSPIFIYYFYCKPKSIFIAISSCFSFN